MVGKGQAAKRLTRVILGLMRTGVHSLPVEKLQRVEIFFIGPVRWVKVRHHSERETDRTALLKISFSRRRYQRPTVSQRGIPHSRTRSAPKHLMVTSRYSDNTKPTTETARGAWKRWRWIIIGFCERKYFATFVSQDGTTGFDILWAVVSVDEEGSVVMAGLSSLDFSGPSVGGKDFVAIKLDSGGTTLWTWQVGRFCWKVFLQSKELYSVGVGE